MLDEILLNQAAALCSPAVENQLAARDEAVRARLEYVLARRWRGAKVRIFGSSASGLRVGHSSDLDLCVILEPHAHESEEARVECCNSVAALETVEAAEPEATGQQKQLEAAGKAERRELATARGATNRVNKWLRKLQAAHVMCLDAGHVS